MPTALYSLVQTLSPPVHSTLTQYQHCTRKHSAIKREILAKDFLFRPVLTGISTSHSCRVWTCHVYNIPTDYSTRPSLNDTSPNSGHVSINNGRKTKEMHIQSKVNHIFRISMLLLHVSALYERHLQEVQRILMKLCVCYVISAE
jgi:hypothetical protein